MHTVLQRLQKRARSIAIAAAATSMVLGNVASVSAAQLTSASTELSDPRSSQTGVTYTFDASGFSGTTLNCIQVVFNDQADGGGAVPTGMTSTGAVINASGTLITEASWTEDHSTNGTLELTYAVGEAPAANGTLVFDTITNGSTEGTTYFAILTSYSDVGCATEVDTVVMAFIYKDGEPVSLTIEPTLNFTCSGVGVGLGVNGATTTHLSDASGIDYLNDVTASTNGISAHDLNVTTNASGGYVVYIRHTGQLTNAASDTIDNLGDTNLSPQTFSAAGSEAWGYTTEDTTLNAVGDGADRFTTPANQWAGFTTSNEEVMVNAAAVPGGETIRVGHQVGVASTTEAGVYTTTIVYTVVATF